MDNMDGGVGDEATNDHCHRLAVNSEMLSGVEMTWNINSYHTYNGPEWQESMLV